MAPKSIAKRNSEQAGRQQKLRDEARRVRRPDRDDLARIVLWNIISEGLRRETQGQQMLDLVYDRACGGLVRQGFAEREIEFLWDALVSRYRNEPWPFRHKRHFAEK